MKKGRWMVPLALLLLLMVCADSARAAAAEGVELALRVVFPALFPFCVVTRQLGGVGSPFLMGLCGGYPLGVYALCEQLRAGGVSRAQAERRLLYCNNTGPAIFFGMVGAMLFPNPLHCAALYGIHILSAILLALFYGAQRGSGQRPAARPEPLGQSIRQAASTTAVLCAYVVSFMVLLRLLLCLPPLRGASPLTEAVLSVLADVSSGLRAMGAVGDPTLRFCLCSAGVSWGGVCVHMQAKGLWQAAGLRPRGYFRAKLLQTAFSLALAIPAARLVLGQPTPLWPAALPVAAVAIKRTVGFSARLRYNGKNVRCAAEKAIT